MLMRPHAACVSDIVPSLHSLRCALIALRVVVSSLATVLVALDRLFPTGTLLLVRLLPSLPRALLLARTGRCKHSSGHHLFGYTAVGRATGRQRGDAVLYAVSSCVYPMPCCCWNSSRAAFCRVEQRRPPASRAVSGVEGRGDSSARMQVCRVQACVQCVATRDGLLRTPSITSSTFTASITAHTGATWVVSR